MNIGAVETRTGLTRANIRFYEAQGLLEPERLPNGYRDYTESHVDTLNKIKLLRQLRVPLEEIKRLQTGQVALGDALQVQAASLGREVSQLENARTVCRAICDDGAAYDSLDAKKYLDALNHTPAAPWLRQDALPFEAHPWRRYLARSLDSLLCSLLFAVLYYLILHRYPTDSRGLSWLVLLFTVLATFLLEPVMLHFFGATPGKWIFGIRVADQDGCRLTYEAAMIRTWEVFRCGEGYCLPGYGLWRNWKSYRACRENALPWDEEFSYTYRDAKLWRSFAFAGAYAAVFGLIVLCILRAQLPIHRGDLTVAEFAENYNRYLRVFVDPSYGRQLDGSGQWEDVPQDQETFYFGVSSTELMEPEFHYTVEDGILTGISYETAYEGDDWLQGYDMPMLLAAMAFAGAQKDITVWNGGFHDLVARLESAGSASFQDTLAGVSIRWDLECAGFDNYGDFLVPADETLPGFCRTALTLECPE